jgi:hypothetical protein
MTIDDFNQNAVNFGAAMVTLNGPKGKLLHLQLLAVDVLRQTIIMREKQLMTITINTDC